MMEKISEDARTGGMRMKDGMGRCLHFLKSEAVLCISAVCALLSMLWVEPSAACFGYIDFRVLCLLFCLMIVVAGFQECGLFTLLAQRLLAGERQLRLLVLILVMLPFFCSMLVTNDVALITFVPFTILVLTLIGRTKYLIRVVVLQTIAANLGSMAMPVGNPQNLYLYANYQLSAGEFFSLMMPICLVSFLILCVASLMIRHETVQVHFATEVRIQNPRYMILFSILFLLCLLSVFHFLNYIVLTAIVVLAIASFSTRKLFAKVDYSLLLTFVCFFIFAGNIGEIDAVRELLGDILNRSTLLTSVVTSQVISNVPAAVLLSGFTQDWKGLLLGTNIGGLGTPIASLASLISLKFYLKSEGAKPLHYLGFFMLANFIGLIGLLGFVLI